MMAEWEACEILEHANRIEGIRLPWLAQWQVLADWICPSIGSVTNPGSGAGQKRNQKIFDSTASRALERSAAALLSFVCPASRKWHTLASADPNVKDDPGNMAYWEALRDQLFRVRYAPASGFASQSYEFLRNLILFGTSAMAIMDDPGRGIKYRTLPVSEISIDTDHMGSVCSVLRKFQLTPSQSIQQFGDRCPKRVRDMAEKHSADKISWYHLVLPAGDKERAAGFRYASRYLCLDGREVLDPTPQDLGYFTLPYIVTRYQCSPGEVYGRSPAWAALPDIGTLNEQEKTILRAGVQAVAPAWLTSEDSALSSFQVRPHALIPGGLSADGTRMIQPLQTSANIPLGIELSNQRRESINETFLVNLFLVFAQDAGGNMTATEATLRTQERGAIMAPVGARLTEEWLSPTITREIDILARAQALPTPPDGVAPSYEVQYESDMARSQRAGDAIALNSTLQGVAALAQLDPSAARTIAARINPDEALKVVASAEGLPAKVMRSDEEFNAIMQQHAQADQQQQMLQAAPVAGEYARNLAQAQAAASPGGGQY